MIKRNLRDGLAGITEMIDRMHRVIVEDDADIETIIAAFENEAIRLDRPRVIDGGKAD